MLRFFSSSLNKYCIVDRPMREFAWTSTIRDYKVKCHYSMLAIF